MQGKDDLCLKNKFLKFKVVFISITWLFFNFEYLLLLKMLMTAIL